MTDKKTCADLVAAEWDSTRTTLVALWEIYRAGESAWDELCAWVEKHPRVTNEKRLRAALSDRAYDLIPYYKQGVSHGGYEGLDNYGYGFWYVEWDADHEYGDFFCWLFSGGGPSDELQFYTTSDLKFKYAEYRYKDWFDGASVRLVGDDAKLAADIFECRFVDSGLAEHERGEVLDPSQR